MSESKDVKITLSEPTGPKPIETDFAKVQGRLDSVRRWIESRESLDEKGLDSEKKRSHIFVAIDVPYIELNLNEDKADHMGKKKVISGLASLSKDMQLFRLDSGEKFSYKELLQLIENNPAKFADQAELETLKNGLLNFDATVQSHIQDTNSRRGKILRSISANASASGIPEQVVLRIRLFEGEKKHDVKTDICFDPNGQGVAFYFRSLELQDLIESEKERLLKESLAGLEEKGWTIIYT